MLQDTFFDVFDRSAPKLKGRRSPLVRASTPRRTTPSADADAADGTAPCASSASRPTRPSRVRAFNNATRRPASTLGDGSGNRAADAESAAATSALAAALDVNAGGADATSAGYALTIAIALGSVALGYAGGTRHEHSRRSRYMPL